VVRTQWVPVAVVITAEDEQALHHCLLQLLSWLATQQIPVISLAYQTPFPGEFGITRCHMALNAQTVPFQQALRQWLIIHAKASPINVCLNGLEIAAPLLSY
jgi:hypothetical protein